MAEIAKRDLPVVRKVLPRDEDGERISAALARGTKPRSSPPFRQAKMCRCIRKAFHETCAAVTHVPIHGQAQGLQVDEGRRAPLHWREVRKTNLHTRLRHRLGKEG